MESKDKSPKQVDFEALSELREFLEKELKTKPSDIHITKPFRPITDGLGLESPRSAVRELPKTKAILDELVGGMPLVEKVTTPPLKKPDAIATELLQSVAKPSTTPEFFEELEKKETLESSGILKARLPPELPRPTAARRLLAVVLDEAFVLTLWASTLIIIANIMTGGKVGFSVGVWQELSNPTALRMASLGFAVIWLAYLTVCLGILDMTFGMWVWGIRIAFGKEGGDSKVLRRVLRIFWSFIFLAPIAPLALLIVRIKKKNLLDLLSGSSLYRFA